jgi:Tol biopolymer transport system component
MSEFQDLIEGELDRVKLRPFTIEGFHRRRYRRQRNQRLAAGTVALVVAIAGIGVAIWAFHHRQRSIPARPSPTPLVGTLAFVSQGGLQVATSDGSTSRVVRRGAYTQFPEYRWSPDGTRIAFLSGQPGGSKTGSAMALFVVNGDGSGQDRLADCTGRPDGAEKGRCDGLSWSPDGTRIAFSGENSLFVVELATGSVRRITGCPSCEYKGTALNPAWSPDGSRIAFTTGDSIDVVAIDGSGWARLAAAPGVEPHPTWSPDGARIVFSANDGIYMVETDGSNLRHLSTKTKQESTNSPTWSPDGTRIAYLSTPGIRGALVEEVWVMNADGTARARLYHSPCCIDGWGGPAWSPDGRFIAFSVWGTIQEPAVYVIGVDGSGLHRIPGRGFGNPVWEPHAS